MKRLIKTSHGIAILGTCFLLAIFFITSTSQQIDSISFSISSLSQSASVADFNNALIAHYTFDDGTANDSSGHSNNGTFSGGAVVSTGKSGQGLDLVGVTGRMNLVTDVIDVGDITLCAWYYAKSVIANRHIINNAKFGLTVSSNSRFTFSSNGTTQAYTRSGSISSNVWQHVCITRDSLGVANFYVDGAQSGTINQNSGVPVASVTGLAVGNHSWTNNAWDGYLDDVRIYSKILSSQEIQDVYSVLGGMPPASGSNSSDSTGANTTTNNPSVNTNTDTGQNNTPENTAPASMTALSCNSSDIQTAINTVKDGGTVIVPAGMCTWTKEITIGTYSQATHSSSNKSVVIKGAGIGKTIIIGKTVGSMMMVQLQAHKPVRITGFTFDGSYSSPSKGAMEIYGYGSTNAFARVDNNAFMNLTARGMTMYSVYGLIDHNQFVKKSDAGSVTHIALGGDIFERTGDRNDSWGRPQDMGTSHAIFIEDNTFDHPNTANGPYDAYEGARYVFRHNVVYGTNLGHHGYDSSYRGIVNFEIYDNTLINASPTTGEPYAHGIGWEIRSGSGVFFNNTLKRASTIREGYGYYDAFALLRNYRSDPGFTQSSGVCNGTNVSDGNFPDLVDVNGDGVLQIAQGDQSSGYPCKDQVGRTSGFDTKGYQTFSPVYSWNNSFEKGKSGVAVIGGHLVVGEHVQVPNTRTSTYHIIEGRDYFNGTPRPGYTPYTYPHPFTTSGFTGDDPSKPLPPPATPATATPQTPDSTVPTISPTQPATPTSADFNHDGAVNTLDFSLMVSAWNTTSSTYDLNHDTTVNTLDYSIMAGQWTR